MDGQQIGSRYVAESLVGQGACGQVWSGHDTDGNMWAIKLLRSELAQDPGLVNRFVAERSLLESIRHPHVVQVHDLVVEGSTLAVVMQFVDGSDLRAVLRRRGPIPPSGVASWGAQVAGALQAAHTAGVVHRDVKPENVLVDASTEAAMLSDFGIARIADGATRSTMMLGTPQYMAPEIAEGETPGPAADLYSLGIMLYELCCGVPPFAGKGSAMATLRAHLGEVPGRPMGIPDVLWDVIATLMAKDPTQRGGTARQIEARLRAITPSLEGIPSAPRLAEPPPAERFLTAAPAVDDAVAHQSAQWARPAMSPIGWSPTPGASPLGYGLPQPLGYATYPPSPQQFSPPQRKGAPVALLGLAAGVLVCGGIAAAMFFAADADEAEASPAEGIVTATATTTLGATKANPGPVVTSPAQRAEPAQPRDGQHPPQPTTPLPRSEKFARPSQTPDSSSPPSSSTATPTRETEQMDEQARRTQAKGLLDDYLQKAQDGSLTPADTHEYFADRVQWYQAKSPLTRDEVYERSQIDRSKPQTKFTTEGVNAFTAAMSFEGREADVMTLDRTFLRPNGDAGRVLVSYTLVYDRGSQSPRIAKVSEKRI